MKSQRDREREKPKSSSMIISHIWFQALVVGTILLANELVNKIESTVYTHVKIVQDKIKDLI